MDAVSTIIKLAEETMYINVDFVGWMSIQGNTRLRFHFSDGSDMTIHYSTPQIMYDDMRKIIASKENHDCSGDAGSAKDQIPG